MAADPEKSEAAQAGDKDSSSSKSSGPPGGFDATPVPHRSPGYDVKITFHRATHLPIADLSTLSSDPYISALLKTNLPTRHAQDPPLTFRTRTVWKSLNPSWDEEWHLAHVPADGFELKIRLYDEDASDKDDRLGNVHIDVDAIDDKWSGIREQAFKIKKKAGSWRAYAIRAIAVCFNEAEEMSGRMYVSVEVLGRSDGAEGGRCYTKGPLYWSKHYSPLLGRIAGVHEHDPPAEQAADAQPPPSASAEPATERPRETAGQDNNIPNSLKKLDAYARGGRSAPPARRAGRYNFQANQFQLAGPVPAELYHRYVEFRPFIGRLFTGSGMRGMLLNKALHKQHTQVYNYNRSTEYGAFAAPGRDAALQFLDLVHYDEGGRIFTYALSLDGILRFTETGKEFGIDLLSKHTMHSDASIYIAYSGEFFVRRVTHPHGPTAEEAQASTTPAPSTTAAAAADAGANPTHPPSALADGPPRSPAPRDPSLYELVIDNDSGTYRPNAALLPLLEGFLSRSFPGLRVVTLDCQRDEALMGRLKAEQRERKKHEGRAMVYTRPGSSGSLSSSDDEELDRRAAAAGAELGGTHGVQHGGAEHHRAQDQHKQQQQHQHQHQERQQHHHRIVEAVGPLVGQDHPSTRKALDKL